MPEREEADPSPRSSLSPYGSTAHRNEAFHVLGRGLGGSRPLPWLEPAGMCGDSLVSRKANVAIDVSQARGKSREDGEDLISLQVEPGERADRPEPHRRIDVLRRFDELRQDGLCKLPPLAEGPGTASPDRVGWV